MANKVVQLTDRDGNNIYPVSASPTMVDIFYPVGSYYETSDTTFDPNVTWGGTWVEDTKGKVTVAKADSGTFSSVGSTGGSETATELDCGDTTYGLTSTSNESYSDRTIIRKTALSSTHAEISAEISLLQPYIVVKRWHRTA